MIDFNSVAAFSVLDPNQKGFLDLESIKNYCNKFQKENPMTKQMLNATLRRMSSNPDGRISFREFCLAITPELAGLSEQAVKIDLNVEKKQIIKNSP